MSDDHGDNPDTGSPAAPPLYGIGPFTLRELILLVVWALAFIVSFFSTAGFVFTSVWTRGIDWILPIGVPTVAVFLIVLRRFSPTGIRRVGSLGIDQFASVAFSVSAVVWLSQVFGQVSVFIAGGPWALGWVPWVQLVLMAAGVVLTVFAPLIPGLDVDFQHRPAAPAHPSARAVRAVSPRPQQPRTATVSAATAPAPYGAEPAPAPAPSNAPAAPYEQAPSSAEPVDEASAPDASDDQAATDSFAPPTDEADDDLDATIVRGDVDRARDRSGDADADAPSAHEDAPAPEAEQAPAPQAFWVLAPVERDVVDRDGTPLFRIGPTAWALAIEDRGSSLVIRDDDGRVGVLTDVSGITRG